MSRKSNKRGRRGYEDDDERDVERGSKSTPTSDEDDDELLFDKKTRKDFVARVYAILTLQLAITFAIIFVLNYMEEVKEFMEDYFWISFIFMGVQIILYCVIVCSQKVRRSYPLNFILLTIHTLFFAALAAWISARYEIIVIWLAFLSTAVITLLVTVFAKFSPVSVFVKEITLFLQDFAVELVSPMYKAGIGTGEFLPQLLIKWDVTGCGMFIFIGFMALMVFSVIALIVNIFIHAPLLYLIISGIMVALLSFYLMFMTQQILGGRKGELEPDEVVFAVIVLYTTIIDIFLHMLRLIGACMGDD